MMGRGVVELRERSEPVNDWRAALLVAVFIVTERSGEKSKLTPSAYVQKIVEFCGRGYAGHKEEVL